MTTARNAAEQDLVERFTASNQLGTSGVMRRIERLVNGCDYGGTSWATREEIDGVGAVLKLGPGQRLLEVGAGTGWPGLYMADQTDCDVMLTDVPLNGLRMATERPETVESGGTIVSGMDLDNIIESVTTAVTEPWDARYEFEEDYSPSNVVINTIRSQITNFF